MAECAGQAGVARAGLGLVLPGLFVFTAAVVALAGSGRMDIIDGQSRYEVARSLVDHGDVEVRDPDVTFCVLPGRNGKRFSLYRLPQSVLGVSALWLADATGPVRETRRQFFFVLTGAVAAGVLAVSYALWLCRLGHRPAAAAGWALAGVFCTPSWYYATSTFDDLLGTTAAVGALTLAWYGRQGRALWFAALAGLALGAALNCKQPLAVFVLPVLAVLVPRGLPRRPALARAALVLAGLALGAAVYEGYEWYKFPPESTADHARLLDQYVPAWPGTPVAAVLVLLLSPAAGVFWYCPTLVLSLCGLRPWWRAERRFTAALLVACAGFTAFFCSLVFFKGDLSWGPRYLTPVFAVLWVLVPAAVALRPRWQVRLILGLGLLVQLLALSVDHHRLYVELRFPSGFYHGHPWIYFHPRAAHLVNRPREIYEIFTEEHAASSYSPTPLPTAATPCPETFERGPGAVRKYRFLDSFRPWWASMTFLAPADRPVDLGRAALLLLGCAAAGAGLAAWGLARCPVKITYTPVSAHGRPAGCPAPTIPSSR
jgi:hypothetical protein